MGNSIYPCLVARWETKAYALLAFLQHPKPIRRYLYTTNQLERLTKEVKRRTKVVGSPGRKRWRSFCTWC